MVQRGVPGAARQSKQRQPWEDATTATLGGGATVCAELPMGSLQRGRLIQGEL